MIRYITVCPHNGCYRSGKIRIQLIQPMDPRICHVYPPDIVVILTALLRFLPCSPPSPVAAEQLSQSPGKLDVLSSHSNTEANILRWECHQCHLGSFLLCRVTASNVQQQCIQVYPRICFFVFLEARLLNRWPHILPIKQRRKTTTFMYFASRGNHVSKVIVFVAFVAFTMVRTPEDPFCHEMTGWNDYASWRKLGWSTSESIRSRAWSFDVRLRATMGNACLISLDI